MQDIAGAGGLGDEMGPHQGLQQPSGGAELLTRERGEGWGVHVVSRVGAEQPEQACGRGVEMVVGRGEHGTYRGQRVAAVEQVEPGVLVGELRDEIGDPVVRAFAEPFRGDAQRQRQAGTAFDQLVDGSPFRGTAVTEQLVEQLARFLDGHQVEVDAVRAVAGDQTGERVPAGDDDEAGPGAGQQGAHLPGGVGVVQHDEQPPAVDQGAETGGALRGVVRDGGTVHPEGTQETRERVGRRHRPVGTVAAQVDVQLPVGEPVLDLVGPTHDQRRLADTGAADHRRDRRRPAGQQLVQLGQLGHPADETGHGMGELSRHDPRCGRGPRLDRCAVQDPLFEGT